MILAIGMLAKHLRPFCEEGDFLWAVQIIFNIQTFRHFINLQFQLP